MLKKHSELFKNLLFISDLIIISLVWIISYYLRFYTELVPLFFGFAPIKPYLLLLVPILLIWGFIFRAFDLYRPRRLSSHFAEILDIAKACTLAVVILIALTFFVRKFEFSRMVFFYFWILSIASLSLSRGIFREALRFMRRRGYNLRHIIVIGDGILAREIVKRITNHPELGLNIIGLVGSKTEKINKRVYGQEIIGTYEDIEKIFRGKNVDQVFICIPFSMITKLENILKSIEPYHAAIKIIPDIYHFLPFSGSIEEFEGLPIISFQDTPLYGWNIVIKRASDIIIALFGIIITLPIMILIALIIKLTSQGPIFYKQKRAGLDGRAFEMLKFRTMHVDAEKETGPVWAKENDQRRTRFGAFLRKTSLDELPQFFNVLKGDMSVVRPRPERPEFIERFRKEIPRYMFRHKMRAGITGWAQVNGWRGDTDLKKRIEHDLYYIENWSIWFDLKVILLTLWRGLINRHAY